MKSNLKKYQKGGNAWEGYKSTYTTDPNLVKASADSMNLYQRFRTIPNVGYNPRIISQKVPQEKELIEALHTAHPIILKDKIKPIGYYATRKKKDDKEKVTSKTNFALVRPIYKKPVLRYEQLPQNPAPVAVASQQPAPTGYSVFGPSNSLIGFVNNNRQFTPATGQYTQGIKSADMDLLGNEANLTKYLESKGISNPLIKKQLGGAFNISLPPLVPLGIKMINKVGNLFKDSEDNQKTAPLVLSQPDETIRIKIADPRKIRATTRSRINPNRDLVSGTYIMNEMKDAIQRGKDRGLSVDDAWNLAAIDFQETRFGEIDNEMGHAKDYEGSDYIDAFLNAYQDKMKKADRLKYKDPYLRLQVYNGLGKIYPETERWYHGFKANSFYGVPVPKTGLDLKKNPLYGIQVTDLRDNILKKNPEMVNLINSIYKVKMKKQYGGVTEFPMMQNGGEKLTSEQLASVNKAKMRAKMALAAEFGNPSAKRMVSYNPPNYRFSGNEMINGENVVGFGNNQVRLPATGTHFMGSMGEYAVPYIQQDTTGKMIFNPNASFRDREAIRFDNPENAQYFAEHYKEVAPMMQNGGRAPIYTDDPRKVRAYNDSLALYNFTNQDRVDNLLRQGFAYDTDKLRKVNYKLTDVDKKEYQRGERVNPKKGLQKIIQSGNDGKIDKNLGGKYDLKAQYELMHGKIAPTEIANLYDNWWRHDPYLYNSQGMVFGGDERFDKDKPGFRKNPNYNKPNAKDKEGTVIRNFFGVPIYKEPVQPYILQKEPRLKAMMSQVNKLPMGEPSTGMGIRERQMPNISAPNVEMSGPYMAGYTDYDTQQGIDRGFRSAEERDAFVEELRQRQAGNYQPGQMNISSYYDVNKRKKKAYGGSMMRNGGLARYEEGGEDCPCPEFNCQCPPGYGTATQGDSLRLYQGALAQQNWFKNHPEYKIQKDPYRSITRNKILSELELTRQLEDRDVKSKKYYNNIDKNRFEQRELTIGFVNKNVPIGVYDRRIQPNAMVTVQGDNISSINNLWSDGSFDDSVIDVIETPQYDPIYVAPWNILNPKQQQERLKKYGITGTPYADPNYKQSKLEPTLKGKPQRVSPLPMGAQTDEPSVQFKQMPQIGERPIQMGEYKVSYYDPEIKDWNERSFMTEDESGKFMNEMSQRGFGSGYGNVTQRKVINKKAYGGPMMQRGGGFGCKGDSKCITGSDKKKKDGISDKDGGGTGTYQPMSNAPVTWEELQTYNQTDPKSREFKARLKSLQGQFPGLTQQQLLAAGADSARLRNVMFNPLTNKSDVPNWDKQKTPYDRAWFDFYRPIMDQPTKVTVPQILQQQPGGFGGFEQNVRGNYGRTKNQDGGSIMKEGGNIDKNYYIGKSKIQGDGAFAKRSIQPGEYIGKVHTIIEPYSKYKFEELGHKHNHSEKPNVQNVLIGNERHLFATRPIRKNQELTSNYRLQPDLEQPEGFAEKNKKQYGGVSKTPTGFIPEIPKMFRMEYGGPLKRFHQGKMTGPGIFQGGGDISIPALPSSKKNSYIYNEGLHSFPKDKGIRIRLK
jgi:hypothetical protein